MTLWNSAQLKAAVKAGVKPLIVCGAGVTTYATNGKAPSWRALIDSGINRVLDRDDTQSAWATYSFDRLKKSVVSDWLAVADELTVKLGGREGAELASWLQDTVGDLEIENRSLYDAIFDLGCPVATTNYDTLLTKASGRNAVSWLEPDAAVRIMRGDIDSILHIHGIVSSPKSIILGQLSYDDIGKNRDNNIIRTSQILSYPTIFVGCSWDGVSDSDFTNIAQLTSNLKPAEQPRYWLVKNDVTSSPATESKNLTIVQYGSNYSELPDFLKTITDKSGAISGNSMSRIDWKTIDLVEPKPIIFGRSEQIDTIVKSILNGGHALISGAPGIGKTALAITCLYDANIISQFDNRRIFVNLENQTEARSILSSTLSTLGLNNNGDDSSLIRQLNIFASNHPFVAILDNAEDAFEEDFLEAERVLRLLCQIPGVSIILTKRDMLPIVNEAVNLGILDKLDRPDAIDAFNATSGRQFDTNDSVLIALMAALDGHALSIQLIAAQARTKRALSDILSDWEQQRALLLKRRGQDEGRLTSVRASLGISLKSKKLAADPLARRLLTILSELPDGILEKDCSSILSQSSIVSSNRAGSAIEILRELNLVEERLDNRIRMLNPLRESVRIDLPISAKDREAVIDKYKKRVLAIEKSSFDDVLFKNIYNEHINSEAACRLAIDAWPANKDLARLLSAFVAYLGLSGLAVDPIWETQAKRFVRASNFIAAIDILNGLGSLEFLRGNVEKAKSLYLKALPYTRQIKQSEVISYLYHGLGRCAQHDGNVSEAKRLYNISIIEMIKTSDESTAPIGNNLIGLGLVALMAGEKDEASEFFKRSIINYRLHKDVLGVANATSFLSKSSDEDVYDSLCFSLSLIDTQKVDASKSNILTMLGDYWYRRGDAVKSLECYEDARRTARTGAHLMNEALAQIRCGQSMIAAGRHNMGVNEILEGFKLWFSTSALADKANVGFEQMKEALVASSPMEALTYSSKAADLWRQIGRFDLIEDWINFQFGCDARNSGIALLNHRSTD